MTNFVNQWKNQWWCFSNNIWHQKEMGIELILTANSRNGKWDPDYAKYIDSRVLWVLKLFKPSIDWSLTQHTEDSISFFYWSLRWRGHSSCIQTNQSPGLNMVISYPWRLSFLSAGLLFWLIGEFWKEGKVMSKSRPSSYEKGSNLVCSNLALFEFSLSVLGMSSTHRNIMNFQKYLDLLLIHSSDIPNVLWL